MSAKKPLPTLVKLAILTAITTFVWIIFDVYRAFTVKPPPEVPEEILAPVNPNLDALVLDRLQQRLYLNEDEIDDTILLNPESGVTVDVSSESEPEPTANPVPEDEPIATEEGEVSE